MKQFNRRLIVSAMLGLFASLAQAQYMWIDEKGLKQLSDRPPPPSTPAKNILKQPHGAPAPVQIAPADSAAGPAASAASAAASASAPPTLAERNADFRKRAEEKAEKDQKAAEEARQKAARKENCVAARQYKAQLDSGQRIGVMSPNGEQGFMGDAERAQRSAQAARVLNDCR